MVRLRSHSILSDFVWGSFTLKQCANALAGESGHPLTRLASGASQVRQEDDIGKSAKGCGDLGLVFVNVQACGKNALLFEGVYERLLFNHRATRGVENNRVGG